MFDVYEASRNDTRRKESSGLWLIEDHWPMLVAEAWEDDQDFVQAVLLHDYDGPGFTIVEFAEAKQLGKARVRVDNRERGQTSALLGQLYVRNGYAAISYLVGSVIALLQIPLANAGQVPDGDYKFNWSLECSKDGKRWKKAYEADPRRSWLNDWRPANDELTDYRVGAKEALGGGLIPAQ